MFVPWDEVGFAEMENYLAMNGIVVSLGSTDEGQHHVVADGLVSKDLCSELTMLDVVRLSTFRNNKELLSLFLA